MPAEKETAIIQYKGESVTISFTDVKEYICPLATRQEVVIFLKTCQSLSLSPWANEIYLIKYSEREKAATVIAIDSYLKAGEANKNYDGHEAGVVLKDSSGKLEFREGSLILDDEYDKLVGGFAKVYRKDRGRPFYMSVNKAECIKYTRDGHPTQFWAKDKQPSMLRKTALKRAMTEAFPSLFAGILSTTEITPEPEYHGLSEGEFPLGYERNGKAYWPKWWARQSEKGLSEDDVHNILGVASLKDDWIGKGKTLEEAEGVINDTLARATERRGEGQEITPLTKAGQDQNPPWGEEPPLEAGIFAEEPPFEGEPGVRLIDPELLKGWEIVKSSVKELKLTDSQIAKWWNRYDLVLTAADFENDVPPPQVTNDMLSSFQTSLETYQKKTVEK